MTARILFNLTVMELYQFSSFPLFSTLLYPLPHPLKVIAYFFDYHYEIQICLSVCVCMYMQTYLMPLIPPLRRQKEVAICFALLCFRFQPIESTQRVPGHSEHQRGGGGKNHKDAFKQGVLICFKIIIYMSFFFQQN